jgi:spore maturation protein CgeB
MKILYVGHLKYGSTSLQRCQALKDIGHNIESIDTLSKHTIDQESKLFNKVLRRIVGATDYDKANERICDTLFSDPKYDVLWIDKGMIITADTLRIVKLNNPSLLIVGYSPDDMGSPHNQSKKFIKSLPFYDFFITTKSYNVGELELLGAKKAMMIDNAYDPNTHYPTNNYKENSSDSGNTVGFIGTYEKERANSIKFAAKNNITISVYGLDWPNYNSENIIVHKKILLGRDYSRAICNFDINLCFLRKINRDLQTTRSIEIPACGRFMLAERTDEHLSLFKEGVEAEFFSSNNEMLDKIKFYLKNPQLRKKIAINGRQRCIIGSYSNQDRLKNIISAMTHLK